MAAKAKNLGRMVNFMSGFQGVTPAGTASINLPVNQRYHRLQLNCAGLCAYTAPVVKLFTLTGQPVPGMQPVITFTLSGLGAVIATPVILYDGAGLTNGTYLAGGGSAGYAIIEDPTGYGATIAVTVAGNSVSAATMVISGATVGPVSPSNFFTSMRLLINGVAMRDILPSQILAIQAASGFTAQNGTLPIWFTEPLRNLLRDNELTSWDLAGQSTFQLQMGIANNIFTQGGVASLAGSMEFDFIRNARPVKNSVQLAAAIQGGLLPAGTTLASNPKVPFLQPVAQHSQSFPISAGRFDITTLPWNNPQTRLWLSGSTPGNIYQVEVMCDGVMIYQATAQQMYEHASEYGFQLGNPSTAPATGGGMGTNSSGAFTGGFSSDVPTTIPNGSLPGANVPPAAGTALLDGYPFDAAVIFDQDNRPWKACRTKGQFILRVYSNVPQNLTVLQETLPGAFSG